MKIFKVVLLALFVVVAGTLWAQGPTGAISGTVLDPQGLPLAGANLTVTNQNTGTEYKLVTSDRGAYIVSALPPGIYSVSVVSSGFRTTTVTDIRVNAGAARSVTPITMELGVVTETVSVEAGSEIVNTSDAVISTTVETKQIQQLPSLNRSPLNFVDLQAGVNNGGGTPRSVNGMRTSYTNVTVDGVNVQDNFIRSNAIDFLPNLLLMSQVNEFTLINQNADPTYGYGASQVTFSTPSGTNAWHGDIFWYHRNNKFAGGDWFSNASGDPKPQLIQNQGGFGVGGPVVRDKLFFYGYWELFRNREQESEATTILTSTARTGTFTYIPTCTVATCPPGVTAGQPTTIDVLAVGGVNYGSALSIDPIMADLLAQVPTTSNYPAIGDGLNTQGYLFSQGSNRTRDNYGFRIDYLPTSKHAISGTWQWNRDIVDRPDIDATFNKAPIVTNDDTTKFLSASWRWSPSGRFTNEARGGFNLAPAIFASARDFGAETMVISNTTLFTNPLEDFRPQGRFTDTWTLQDNATYVWGDHTLKFGAFFQHIKAAPFSSFNIPPTCDIGISSANPAFLGSADFPGGASSGDRATANDLLASLAGFMDTCTVDYNVTSRTSGFVEGAIERREFHLNNLSFYASDSWRLRPNLTLNLGVRWEYAGVFDEKDALMLTPVLSSRTTEAAAAQLLNPNATFDFTGAAVDRPVYDRDLNNFGPQIGIAWDPWGDGKTSIRAGYSISYVNDEAIRSADNATSGNDGLLASSSLGNLTTTVSQFGSLAFTPPTYLVPRTLQDNFNEFGIVGPFSPATIFEVDPKLSTPYVQQWNLSIQREVGWDTAVEVRYMGNHGVQLTRAYDFNQVNGLGGLIGRDDWLTDWTNARNNAFLAEANGLGFDPFCNGTGVSNTYWGIPEDPFGIGCVPLPYVSQIGGIGGYFYLSFIQEYLREGRAGELAFLYHYNDIDSDLFVPNPLASVADLLTNYSTSTYHAGVIEVRRRPTRGLYFQANYTFSKVLTDSDGEAQHNFDPLLDIINPGVERARAGFDLTHVFKANFVYDLPMGRGHNISAGNWVDKVIGGWSVGSIFTWQTGAPFSILSNRGTLNRNGRSVGRNTAYSDSSFDAINSHVGLYVTPDGVYVIDPAIIGDDGRGVGDDLVSCDYTLSGGGQGLFCNPAISTLGNLSRYAFNNPTYFNWDFSIIKNTPINERWGVEFRAEFFNLPNHPTFWSGNCNSSSDRTCEDINSASFGLSTATLSDRRIVQFGLRVTF